MKQKVYNSKTGIDQLVVTPISQVGILYLMLLFPAVNMHLNGMESKHMEAK